MSIRHDNDAVVTPLTLISGIAYLFGGFVIAIKQECDDILNDVAHLGDKGTKNFADMQIKLKILPKRLF